MEEQQKTNLFHTPAHLASSYIALYTELVQFNRAKDTIFVDHRVSDEAEAAQFMQTLAGFLENPVSMLV